MPHHQTYIAGVKYRKGANERLSDLPHDVKFRLEPEPENPYDQFAVRVLDPAGFHVGYVPKELSHEVTRLLERGRIVKCERTGFSRIEIHYEDE